MNLLHPRGVCSSSSSMWHGDTSLLLLTAFCCLCLFSSLPSPPLIVPSLHVLHKLISHKYSPCPKQQLPHERGYSTAVCRTCHAPSAQMYLYLHPFAHLLCIRIRISVSMPKVVRPVRFLVYASLISFAFHFVFLLGPREKSKQKRRRARTHRSPSGRLC